MYTQVLAPCEDTGRQGAAREAGVADRSGFVDEHRTGVRERPPLPASPPRTAGGRGDVAARTWARRHGSNWRPTGAPLPRPLSPLRGRKGENSIALRRASHCVPPPPLPRSWGRGRPPSRGTSERPGGGEGPRPREEAPLPAQLPSNPSENPHLRRSSSVQEFGISCRIPPLLPFASACESLACSIPMTAECRPRVHKSARGVYVEATFP
jgi:hypothetical protein